MKVLGIETSCDDTSLAIFSGGEGILCNLTANQVIHDLYGGVVPEIASRAHMKNLLMVFDELLKRSDTKARDLDGIGVSNGPGLIGSLLVGVGFARALAFGLQRPIVGVHHIEAHILSNELEGQELHTPCLALVVSGGHTTLYRIARPGGYELVGNTRDDAAGECFDKIAKLLGLGFPGGPVVERVATSGNAQAVAFPRAMMEKGNFDFSFSGLKTAVRLHVEKQSTLNKQVISDVAASAQEAIVEALVEKTVACAIHNRLRHVYLAGGVAANGVLRDRLAARCSDEAIEYHAPLLEYCTDNGAMIARTAERHLSRGRNDAATLDVFARGPIPSWT
jgi:N6-L-threonylcarbamoyladenine synthase